MVALFPVLCHSYSHLQYIQIMLYTHTTRNDSCGMRTGNEANPIKDLIMRLHLCCCDNYVPRLAFRGSRIGSQGYMRCDQSFFFCLQVPFQLLVLLCLGRELVRSGWTMCSAMVQRRGWRSVGTMAGGTLLATIPVMPL